MSKLNKGNKESLNDLLKKRGCIAYDISSHAKVLKGYSKKMRDEIIRIYSRKHFYKICIVTGKSLIEYADRAIVIQGTTLFFGNPLVPYSWEVQSEQVGYCCLFTEDFIKAGELSTSFLESPLFKIGGTPIFELDEIRKNVISYFLSNMVAEQESNYNHKDEIFRNYISLIIHEALKMQPSVDYFKPTSSAARLTSLFLDLLERQFPIDAIDKPLQLRNPNDFAQQLCVHVNYLNRAVKHITGKPTSAHITERIARESKHLLQHTNWSISEIGYALSFEYPSYFNSFIKKNIGFNPSALRGK